MKISASIYSAKHHELRELVQELDELNIDFLHIDCFEDKLNEISSDIKLIRSISVTPLDFHAITSQQEPFYDFAIENDIEQLTFQFENIDGKFYRDENYKGDVGISITSNTSIDALKDLKDEMDFILLMTTEPGMSGGQFDKESFQKINTARKMFPGIPIHVDGGINAEVSFILRLLGVDSAVSGSFLVNHRNIAHALSELRFHQKKSSFKMTDFMMEREALPILDLSTTDFAKAVQTMDEFGLGFVLFEKENLLYGVCSNADLRKGILANIKDLSNISLEDIINIKPVVINKDATSTEMIGLIKEKSFPILFLPVLSNQYQIEGAILFNSLIKGEG